MKNHPPHPRKALGLVLAGILLGGLSGPWAQAAAAAPPSYEAEILRRLQELESQVAQYRTETARLQAELARRESGQAALPLTAAVPSPQGKPAAADEWGEPEVVKKAEGRDEEARRRLTALETQYRKTAAEAAKQDEAQRDKVKYDFSAKFKTRVNVRDNFNLDNPAQAWKYDNATFVDYRFQLGIEASYDQFLAKFLLDKGNFVFDWKEDGEGTLERWGQFQTVNSAMVRELYAQYTGSFMVRLGRQNWEGDIVLQGPMDSIRLQYPFGQLPWGQTTLTAGYLAVSGGWPNYTGFKASGGPPAGDRGALLGAYNDLDAYYLDLDIRASKALRIKPYLIKVIDNGNAGSADLNLDKDFDDTTMRRDGGFEPLWTGLTASAEFKGLKLDAEAVWLTGDVARGRKVDAHAFLVQANRDFGPVASLKSLSAGLQFGLGSGNGTRDNSGLGTGTLSNFNGLSLCRDRNKFGNIFSEDIRAGYFLWDSNLSNITYVRLDATLEPVKSLRLTPSISRIWTTEPVFAGAGPVFDWSRGFNFAITNPTTASTTRTTNDVGWEIDLDMTYPLYKNLDGFLSLGYFKPGAVYARPDGSNPKAAYEIVLGGEFKF